ncbi:MAG: proline dehydrogenase family protein, partial [Flavobacterium sp.]
QYYSKIKEDVKSIKVGALALKISSFYMNAIMIDFIVWHVMKHSSVNKIFLDAESHRLHDKENEIYDALVEKYNKDRVFLYKTYQMYRKDSLDKLKYDMRTYKNLGIKLVRGAYMQQDRQHGILYGSKEETDSNYDEAIKYAGESKHKVLVATHNNVSIRKAMNYENIEFAQLLGMNDLASKMLYDSGYVVYKYIPYGGFMETYPYLARRLYENFQIREHLK